MATRVRRSGVAFRVPQAWYGGALAAVGFCAARDTLWLCTDDDALAAAPHVRAPTAPPPAPVHAAPRWLLRPHSAPAPGPQVAGHPAVSWASLGRSGCAAPDSEPPWLPLLADWFVMQRAAVLLLSNSTFSFTAALASDTPGATFLRPDPALRAFRRADPWDELPLLPSAAVPANHGVHSCMGPSH
jgi:hypothetical protein